jgi:hypothetical protein
LAKVLDDRKESGKILKYTIKETKIKFMVEKKKCPSILFRKKLD